MFTGIIEGLGAIAATRPAAGEGLRLTVTADFALDGAKIGDSIAVNGACLTAVTISGRSFTVDVSPETLSLSTFRFARPGDRVNLERAMRLSDRLDGHLVSGHIDGTGVISARRRLGNAIIIDFEAGPELTRYMIRKGSVAVDGASLTINNRDAAGFSVSIIPHTAGLTTLGLKKPGDSVNLEADMIGKYVERFLSPGHLADRGGEAPKSGVDLDLLARNGFL